MKPTTAHSEHPCKLFFIQQFNPSFLFITELMIDVLPSRNLRGGGYQPDLDFSHFCTVLSTAQPFLDGYG